MNHHEACYILGISDYSNQDTWKKAYRDIIKKNHPDNNNNSEACKEVCINATIAFEFLENEFKSRMNNSLVRTPKIIGQSNAYQHNHSEYIRMQKSYSKKKEEEKALVAKELKKKSEMLDELNRKKKEEEILNEIRWLRIANIIKKTIEEDKKRKE